MDTGQPATTSSAFARIVAELKRRHVLKIGASYIAGAWLAAEIISFFMRQALAPDWAFKLLAAIYVIGFLVTLALAWVIQIDEQGEWTIDRSDGHPAAAGLAVGLGLVATVVIGWIIVPDPPEPPPYQPMPRSVGIAIPDLSGNLDRNVTTLRWSLAEGLDRFRELTQVALDPGALGDEPVVRVRDFEVEWLLLGEPSSDSTDSLLTLRLMNVDAGHEQWRQSFDLARDEPVHIAFTAGGALMATMSLPAPTMETFTGTNQPEAFTALIDAISLASLGGHRQLENAIERLQAVIDLDDRLARAHSLLARCIHEVLSMADVTDEERQRLENRAREAVDLALKLDNESADAIASLGLWTDTRELRVQAFERAVELDPDRHQIYFDYARQMVEDGRLDDARRLVNRALRYAPMEPRYRALAETLAPSRPSDN